MPTPSLSTLTTSTHSYWNARIAALRQGTRWWPAEVALRLTGVALLLACRRLAAIAHRLANVPAPHPAGAIDLALCALILALLCGGLVLTFYGPGLLRAVPLPGYFTRQDAFRPGNALGSHSATTTLPNEASRS